MMSFFKIDKQKAIIFVSLLLIALIFTLLNNFSQAAMMAWAQDENKQAFVFGKLLPKMNWLFLILRFYLYTCVVIYIVNKTKVKPNSDK